MPSPVPPVTTPTALPSLCLSNQAMGSVVIAIWAPAAPAPMAKVKRSIGANPDPLLRRNMETELQRSETTTTFLEPKALRVSLR